MQKACDSFQVVGNMASLPCALLCPLLRLLCADIAPVHHWCCLAILSLFLQQERCHHVAVQLRKLPAKCMFHTHFYWILEQQQHIKLKQKMAKKQLLFLTHRQINVLNLISKTLHPISTETKINRNVSIKQNTTYSIQSHHYVME